MMFGLFGKKVGNTQAFDEFGAYHVSIIKLLPMEFLSFRKEGSVVLAQFAYGDYLKRPNKATVGHFKKYKLKPRRKLAEFAVTKEFADKFKSGEVINGSVFSGVSFVDVTGIVKGAGFAGVVKRHGFSMQPATHGNSLSHRAHGSTGQCQDPGRVFKGKKMAGQMGNVQRTIQSIGVFKLDLERGFVWLKGAVPGPVGGCVKLSAAIKKSQVLSENKSLENKEEAA